MSKLIVYLNKSTPFSIYKSQHLLENRGSSKYFRDQFISDDCYKSIFKLALINGLRSFRGKQVVITCKSYNNTFFSILVEVPKDSNKLRLITVYHSYTPDFWRVFVKIPYRINLLHSSCQYIIKPLTAKQKATKDLAKIDHTIRREGTQISARELLAYYNI